MPDNKKKSPYLTTGERVSSYIVVAFVLSLIVHLAAAPFFPGLQQRDTPQKVEKVTVVKHKIVVPTPSPTPPPTPTPPPQATPQPKTVQQPKIKLDVVKTKNNNNATTTTNVYVPPKQGSEVGVPQGVGTPSPAPPATPAPTAKPACAVPFKDAVATNIVQADYPDSAREMGLGEVVVSVEVTVAPNGSLASAKILQSSNNMAMDQAALRAARESSYSPKIVDCQPVTGSYRFTVDFQPN